jgi:hypothetical protein
MQKRSRKAANKKCTRKDIIALSKFLHYNILLSHKRSGQEVSVQSIYFGFLIYSYKKSSSYNFFYYYQPLHNHSFYSYMFRLNIVAIIRESLFTDVYSVQYVIEW